MKGCQELLEDDWELYEHDLEGRLKTQLLACAIISDYFCGLCGKEITHVDLGAMSIVYQLSRLPSCASDAC